MITEVLIEGNRYDLQYLNTIVEKFPENADIWEKNNDGTGTLTSVGYLQYNSQRRREDSMDTIVYMLPKPFKNIKIEKGAKGWLSKFLLYHYVTLKKYKLKHYNSPEKAVNWDKQKSEAPTIIDIFVEFNLYYSKNKKIVHFKYIEGLNRGSQKTCWVKTTQRVVPIIQNKKNLIFPKIVSKKKEIDTDFFLIKLFLSILNYLHTQVNNMPLKMEPYKVLRGKAFHSFLLKSAKTMKVAKSKFYEDRLKQMLKLCEMFIDWYTEKKKPTTYSWITTSNYNIIFEDMVDELLANKPTSELSTQNPLTKLKTLDNGLIIDHLFEEKSIIGAPLNLGVTCYIGDSKYYKTNDENEIELAKGKSIAKQFTYAKTIIDYLANLNNKQSKKTIRILDHEYTKGYEIVPNFFLYGYVHDSKDYDSKSLVLEEREINESAHFKWAIFDRDTLNIYNYKVNYLFLLKTYISSNKNHYSNAVRENIKQSIAQSYLSRGYEFFSLRFLEEISLKKFIETNFHELIGKSYSYHHNGKYILLIAKHKDDTIMYNWLKNSGVLSGKEYHCESKYKYDLLSKNIDIDSVPIYIPPTVKGDGYENLKDTRTD